ncbi:alpha/beta fold hydrolase [Thalassomonas sp. M1454]|uniref:alpha/beta fold hydrolase n=1 Tax=Thalassomonas sp. M1454 TaxID=2594477 RepID=UPI001181165B|nr:alpha/beta hydrolase [Thalassomonas sp. M1454]TRX55701.1 alpha/beta hydrolase [Thalassomonas sp. M1454]
MLVNEDLMQGATVSGSGPAVVLLHSSLSSSKQWRLLVSMLSKNYLCINIDLLGYGSAPEVIDAVNYSLNTEVERVMSIVNHVIGTQGFHLVGHSFGGANALKISVENPDRLLSLSLFEPVAFHLLEKGSEVRKQVDEFAHNVAISSNEEGARIFTNTWNKPGFFDQLPIKMQRLMAQDIDKVNLDFKGLISENYTAQDLDKITCLVNLMCGTQSPDISKTLISILQNNITGSSLTEFDAGHMAPISHANDIANKIEQFIDSIV